VLNGETMQAGHTKYRPPQPFFPPHTDTVRARNQLFSVAQALAFLSQGTTLMPGSMLMTGTPAGVGFTRTPPVVLRHSDVVETSVGGGIGTLINTVVEEGKGGECV
jgi:2-keto-4-pentenoate hydratase/2-oxohepta-3-ene-1,7-dioic acid hydratase in catechol pathway